MWKRIGIIDQRAWQCHQGGNKHAEDEKANDNMKEYICRH